MTDQTQTTTEPVERESAHDAARRLFAVQYPGRSFEDIRELSKISWFVAAYNELADRNTTPQPLAIGLDREAVADAVHRGRFPADRDPTPFETEDRSGREYCFRIADEVLALSAPAEGYVLVPVEPTEAMIEVGTRTVSSFGRVSNGVCNAYRKMVQIAACLPAAPTGGRS